MAELHEALQEPRLLTDAELDELERLATVSTGRPWMVEREQLKPTAIGRERGCTGEGFVETTIHTAWDHGQLKGPAPVITTANGPFYEPTRSIHIREDDADFIVAACNAIHRLLAEVRQARATLQSSAAEDK